MKQILLSYALAALCTGRKTVRVHLRHYALYPHVLGERLVFSESVQKRTFGNLFAHALYFLQLLPAEFYGRIGYLVKVDFTRRNLICGVNYVFCPETGAKRSQVLGCLAGQHFGGGEGVHSALKLFAKALTEPFYIPFIRGILLFCEIINEQSASHGS